MLLRVALLLLSMAAGAAEAQKIEEMERQAEAAQASGGMVVHMLRLRPGDDLQEKLAAYAKAKQLRAAVLLTTVGSLTEASLRFADQPNATLLKGRFEIVSLVGTLDRGSMHVHLSVSDGTGRTVGGHLMPGCRVYTTAEIAIGEIRGLQFAREPDAASGYEELKVRKRKP